MESSTCPRLPTGSSPWRRRRAESSGSSTRRKAAATTRFYLQHRGVSFWEGTVDGQLQRRILMGTGDAKLFALDAETGRLIPEFGEEGWVDLDGGMTTRWPKSIYTVTSPVAVYKNVVVTGSRLSSGQENKGPQRQGAGLGRVHRVTWCGSFTPFPGPASRETRPGRETRGRNVPAPTPGPSSAWTRSGAGCSSPRRPPWAATVTVRTCTETPWWCWTPSPENSSGTTRRSATTRGTTISRPSRCW